MRPSLVTPHVPASSQARPPAPGAAATSTSLLPGAGHTTVLPPAAASAAVTSNGHSQASPAPANVAINKNAPAHSLSVTATSNAGYAGAMVNPGLGTVPSASPSFNFPHNNMTGVIAASSTAVNPLQVPLASTLSVTNQGSIQNRAAVVSNQQSLQASTVSTVANQRPAYTGAAPLTANQRPAYPTTSPGAANQRPMFPTMAPVVANQRPMHPAMTPVAANQRPAVQPALAVSSQSQTYLPSSSNHGVFAPLATHERAPHTPALPLPQPGGSPMPFCTPTATVPPLSQSLLTSAAVSAPLISPLAPPATPLQPMVGPPARHTGAAGFPASPAVSGIYPAGQALAPPPATPATPAFVNGSSGSVLGTARSSLGASIGRRYPQMPQSVPPQQLQPPPHAKPPGAAQQRPLASYPNTALAQRTAQMALASNSSPRAAAGVLNVGFNGMWGTESVDLKQSRHVLPPQAVEPPRIVLPHEHNSQTNCSPGLMRCTLSRVPESDSVLQKCRLPFGIVLHPFKDLLSLPVMHSTKIVRCRACRTYINPFVSFIDQRRWKCNICYRSNELPEEFQYDPVSKMYGDPSRRPECKSATVEFIAPSEYMSRPPQPACYVFVLDVSYTALDTGYVRVLCDTLLQELDHMPGDSRTLIGFITYDENVHFFNLGEGCTVPQMMVVGDVDDIFVPSADGVLVNLADSYQLVSDLLVHLPELMASGGAASGGGGSAFGAALQAARKLVYSVGGRVTSFVASLPSRGPGALKSREDPNNRAGGDVAHLAPATDFYKQMSLECSSQYVAVDIFCLANSYVDLATLAGVSQFSGGCVHHYPALHAVHNPAQMEAFESGLRRYLGRKIGFESVMRIRCTNGLSIHTFHGNSFVRSTNLLSLANVNPDSGFAIQVAFDESLTNTNTASFQVALLYTSNKGDRRIRVHTLCLPVTPNMHEVIHAADQQAIVSLLAKMAVDRSVGSCVSDAREALVNSVTDALGAYRATLSSAGGGLVAPLSLRLLPLYVLALLKHPAFRSGTSTKLDDRCAAMLNLKNLPLYLLMTFVYPDLYAVHQLDDQNAVQHDEVVVPQPARLQLSAEFVDTTGIYLMDTLTHILILVGARVADDRICALFGYPSIHQMPQEMTELPEVDNEDSTRLRNFVAYLQASRPFAACLCIFRETSRHRRMFVERLLEDRSEASFSYVEFIEHLRLHVK